MLAGPAIRVHFDTRSRFRPMCPGTGSTVGWGKRGLLVGPTTTWLPAYCQLRGARLLWLFLSLPRRSLTVQRRTPPGTGCSLDSHNRRTSHICFPLPRASRPVPVAFCRGPIGRRIRRNRRGQREGDANTAPCFCPFHVVLVFSADSAVMGYRLAQLSTLRPVSLFLRLKRGSCSHEAAITPLTSHTKDSLQTLYAYLPCVTVPLR